MMRHTVLLIYRNFNRFKTIFFINLIGLSTGMACTLLIWMWVKDEMKVDSFFENDDRLFQVMQNMNSGNGVETIEATPGLLARSLEEEMPEVEHAAVVVPPTFNISKGVISAGDTAVNASAQYVSRNFLGVFSYQLIHGQRSQSLADKKSIVISKSLAKRLFGSVESAVGGSIRWHAHGVDGLFLISAVLESLPRHATGQFDVLLNYDVFEDVNPEAGWGNSGPRTFVLLKEGTAVDQFNEKLKGFMKSKDSSSTSTLFVQRYSDRYLNGTYHNGVPAGGRIEYVWLFSIVGVIILIIACINFANLSTAKALRRIKDIGIKRVMGAGKRTLIFQSLAESTAMSFLSVGVAVLFVDLFMDPFNRITGKQLSLNVDAEFVILLVCLATIAGLMSGIYPGLYLSRLKPMSVLKGKVDTVAEEVWMRKGLVTFQFAVSVVLISSVWIVYAQLQFVQARNLGYNRDHVVYFNTEKMSEGIMEEILNIPGVLNAGGGSLIAGNPLGGSSADWEGKDPENKTFFQNLWCTYGLMETLGMEMVAGSAFSEESGSYDQIILNEKAIESMGLRDPLGKTVNIRGQQRQIVGIVRNFHFESLYEQIKPCALLLLPVGFAPRVSVRIQAGKEKQVLESLDRLHHKYSPSEPFDFKFMEDDYQLLYAGEQRVSKLVKYFAGLAVLISCMGLFGISSFVTERRVKEVGVRKVLGASVFRIVLLLSGEFSRVVLISILIALPASFFIAKQWLDHFAFKISLSWWYFAGAGSLAMLVAWLTVAAQALKAARANPVKCLRDE